MNKDKKLIMENGFFREGEGNDLIMRRGKKKANTKQNINSYGGLSPRPGQKGESLPEEGHRKKVL